jgi:hypothetical protein
MQGIGIEFEWVKYPDYRVEVTAGTPGSLVSEASTKRLVASGPPQAALKTTPLEKIPDLYLRLAKADPTLEGHKRFAKSYGLLTDQQEDYLYEWPKLVQNMRDLVSVVAANSEDWTVQNGKYTPYDLPAKFVLRFGPHLEGGGRMALKIVPANLYNALVLQCVSSRAAGGEIRSCKACGDLFEVGGSSGHRTKRQFCSDACRFEFSHRARRGKR